MIVWAHAWPFHGNQSGRTISPDFFGEMGRRQYLITILNERYALTELRVIPIHKARKIQYPNCVMSATSSRRARGPRMAYHVATVSDALTEIGIL